MKLKAFLYKIVSPPFDKELEVGSFSYIQDILYSKDIGDFENDKDYLGYFLKSVAEEVQKVLGNLDIREIDITPFLNNIRINFSGNGISNGSLLLQYSDETLQNKLNSRLFRIQFNRNYSSFLNENNFKTIIEKITENKIISFKDVINYIRNYDFIRIIDDDTQKTIFIGVIKSYEFSIGVDQVYSLAIELGSIMDFFQYNHINTLEAIYNKLKLSLPEDELKKFEESLKNIINFDALIPFENWFQNKTFEEIIRIIFQNFLFAKVEVETDLSNMKIPQSFINFLSQPISKNITEVINAETINEIKKIKWQSSLDDYAKLDIVECFPSLYNLFINLKSKKIFFGIKFLILLHFIYDYIEDGKPIAYFIIEKDKHPYILKIIENFDMVNFQFGSLYSILDEIAKNLIYEFFEQVGSIIFFKPPYYNLREIIKIKDKNLVNFVSYKYNKQTTPNIYTVNMVKDVLGDLSSVYLLRSFIDFNSIMKYGSNIGGSITSPFGKDFSSFGDLVNLARLFYAYDITNLNTASLSLVDLFIYNKPFILNQAYDIIFKQISENLSGYLKEISINYSVDMIPNVNLNFIYIDRIFRRNLTDNIKIARLNFVLDISSAMAIDYQKEKEQNGNEVIKINDRKKSKDNYLFNKTLCLLLINSKLWYDLKKYLSDLRFVNKNDKNTILGFGIGFKSKFDGIKKQNKLEPISNVLYKDYLAKTISSQIKYENFKINEQTIIQKKDGNIFVNMYGLFYYCMSLISSKNELGSSITGATFIENEIESLNEGIKQAMDIRQEQEIRFDMRKDRENMQIYNGSINLIYSVLTEIQDFFNEFENLLNSPGR